MGDRRFRVAQTSFSDHPFLAETLLCAVFSQNWFEAVVEVVMEKPVPPANYKLIVLLELVK